MPTDHDLLLSTKPTYGPCNNIMVVNLQSFVTERVKHSGLAAL